MQLSSAEIIKSYLLHAPCMAFLSVHAVLRELQNNECRIIDVKGLQIERSFYFTHLQGQAEPLAELFMKFTFLYQQK
jgi:hypothetical protein